MGAQNGGRCRQVVGNSGFTVLGFYYVANEKKTTMFENEQRF